MMPSPDPYLFSKRSSQELLRLEVAEITPIEQVWLLKGLIQTPMGWWISKADQRRLST